MSSMSNVTEKRDGQCKHFFIYEIPLSRRELLCSHLDEMKVWTELAQVMGFRQEEVKKVDHQRRMENSTTRELLNIWGGRYNHTVTELFLVLKTQKLYQAMAMLKDFVDYKYHILIPSNILTPNELQTRNIINDSKKSKKLWNHDATNVSRFTNEDILKDTILVSEDELFSQQQASCNPFNERTIREYASSMLEIAFEEMTEATNNWKETNILGRGGFGTVFKGYWKYTDVAIKQIHYREPNGNNSIKVQIQQSLNELKYLNTCRHDNILPLYGYSIKGEKPCLIYQLMKGGSLEQRLKSTKLPLLWQQRMNICLGTARGVNYLHTFRIKPLIHGDIKPANILLDQYLQPKLGDFGLTREGPDAINASIEVKKVFGTKPYLPPEFLNSKKLSTQVDTYSFGVVLLETFTGMRAYEKGRQYPLLTDHVIKISSSLDDQLIDLIDKSIPSIPNDNNVMESILSLGLECISTNPFDRPNMVYALNMIENLNASS